MRTDGLDLESLMETLEDPRSVPDLQRYFGGGSGGPAFTGALFDRLDGSSYHPEFQNTIIPEDLIAVEMLSVRVPRKVVRDLLEGQLGESVATELRQIPVDVDLKGDRALQYIQDGGPADRAWCRLTECEGVGWVIAGKILARKRPRLIPVYDEIVQCAFRVPDHFWLWLHERLRSDGAVLADRLGQLRAKANLPAQVRALRVLDVVIWMRHRQSHSSTRCQGLGG